MRYDMTIGIAMKVVKPSSVTMSLVRRSKSAGAEIASHTAPEAASAAIIKPLTACLLLIGSARMSASATHDAVDAFGARLKLRERANKKAGVRLAESQLEMSRWRRRTHQAFHDPKPLCG
jgi:hypothetical protein